MDATVTAVTRRWSTPEPGRFHPHWHRMPEHRFAFGLAAGAGRMGLAARHLDFPILDVGCGDCALHARLREAGWVGTYVGLDANPAPERFK